MAGQRPNPKKNSDGQQKMPSANPTGAANQPPPTGPPSLVPPGGPPSMDQLSQAQQMQKDAQDAIQQQSMQHQQAMAQQQQQSQAQLQQLAAQHQNALQMQQMKGDQALQQAQAAPGQGGSAPSAPPSPGPSAASAPAGGGAGPAQPSPAPAPQAPPGADQGINPSQWPHNQVREGINFKDLPPLGQAQAQEQEGINPAAPLQMIQSQVQSSLAEPGGAQGGPQQGPVPASLIGPMVPPGVENFPHDLAALTQVMQRGFSPGADNAEHEMALNAHSMAKASVQHAQNQGQQQTDDGAVKGALAGLMQHLTMSGQLPHPAEVAAHAVKHGSGPLTSSY